MEQHDSPGTVDHPRNPGVGQVVKGRQLEPGEEIMAGDVYDSTSGSWQPVPEALIGGRAAGKDRVVLVRPEE